MARLSRCMSLRIYRSKATARAIRFQMPSGIMMTKQRSAVVKEGAARRSDSQQSLIVPTLCIVKAVPVLILNWLQ